MNKIIIEMNGLPGSGKSYLSGYLYLSFIEYGYKTVLINEMMEELVNTKHSKRILNILRHLSVAEYLCGIKYFFDIRPWRIERLKFIFLLWETYASYYTFIKNSSADILIADEGGIQRILSIIFPEIVPEQFFDRAIRNLRLKNHIVIINMNISVEKALDRIINRKSLQGRIDRMSDAEKNNALIKQWFQLEKIREKIVIKEWFAVFKINSSCEKEELFIKLRKEINYKDGI